MVKSFDVSDLHRLGRDEVRKLWREYSDAIFKEVDVVLIQRQETEKAFLAGMISCLGFVSGEKITSLPDDAGCMVLDAFQEELFRRARAHINSHLPGSGENAAREKR